MPGWRLRGTLIIQFVSGIRLCGVQDVQGLWVKRSAINGFQVQGMLQDLAQRALRVQCKTRQVETQAYFQG